MLIPLGTMIFGLCLGLFLGFLFKSNVTFVSSIRKDFLDIFPRKKLYWKNEREHFSTRYPELYDHGYIKGSMKIVKHFIFFVKRNVYWLNPFTPYEIKVILSKDCLGYDLSDFAKLRAFYSKRNGIKELQ